jgi:hypothetical protein
VCADFAADAREPRLRRSSSIKVAAIQRNTPEMPTKMPTTAPLSGAFLSAVRVVPYSLVGETAEVGALKIGRLCSTTLQLIFYADITALSNPKNLEQALIDKPLYRMQCSDLRDAEAHFWSTVDACTARALQEMRLFGHKGPASLHSVQQSISMHTHMHLSCAWSVTSHVVIHVPGQEECYPETSLLHAGKASAQCTPAAGQSGTGSQPSA